MRPMDAAWTFHRCRQGLNLHSALRLNPLAEERILENAHPRVGVATRIARLYGGLARADDERSIIINPNQYRRQLWTTIPPHGGQHSTVIRAYERTDLVRCQAHDFSTVYARDT